MIKEEEDGCKWKGTGRRGNRREGFVVEKDEAEDGGGKEGAGARGA